MKSPFIQNLKKKSEEEYATVTPRLVLLTTADQGQVRVVTSG